MLSWFNVSPQKLSWDLRACLNSAETCKSKNNKHSVNQLFSFTFLVNQEFLFSKKISRFVWVHSELFLSLRCLRKWRDWNWNYWTNFPKSLIFDSMEYQNIKMSRKCQAYVFSHSRSTRVEKSHGNFVINSNKTTDRLGLNAVRKFIHFYREYSWLKKSLIF